MIGVNSIDRKILDKNLCSRYDFLEWCHDYFGEEMLNLWLNEPSYKEDFEGDADGEEEHERNKDEVDTDVH